MAADFSGGYADLLQVVATIEAEDRGRLARVLEDLARDHRVNPMSPGFGSSAFGVENGGDAGRPVTDHDALMGDGDRAGYLDRRTESLQNVAWAISGQTAFITPNHPIGPTNFQRSVIGGSTFGY